MFFIILLIIAVIICAMVFCYKQRKKLIARRENNILLTTRQHVPEPVRPEEQLDIIYQAPPIYTISKSLDSGNIGSHGGKALYELPPSYDEALEISENTNSTVGHGFRNV